jgi:hypothetical protein
MTGIKSSLNSFLWNGLTPLAGILFLVDWWQDPTSALHKLLMGVSFLLIAARDRMAQRVGHVSWFQRDDASYKDFKALDGLSLVIQLRLIIALVLLLWPD